MQTSPRPKNEVVAHWLRDTPLSNRLAWSGTISTRLSHNQASSSSGSEDTELRQLKVGLERPQIALPLGCPVVGDNTWAQRRVHHTVAGTA